MTKRSKALARIGKLRVLSVDPGATTAERMAALDAAYRVAKSHGLTAAAFPPKGEQEC